MRFYKYILLIIITLALCTTVPCEASEKSIFYAGGGNYTFFNESDQYIKNDIPTQSLHLSEYRNEVLYISLYDFRDAFKCAVYHNSDENCIYIKFRDSDIWQEIENNNLYVNGIPFYNPISYINNEGIPMVPLEPCASVIGYNGNFEVSEEYPNGFMVLCAPSVPHTLSYLELNKEAQLVTVYGKHPAGYTAPVKYMLCSSGVSNSTPNGTFKINPIGGKWTFFPKYKCYVMYCSQIVGDVCIHSIPFDSKSYSSLSPTGYANIGSEASHGCVRLFSQDAMFIHQNCKNLPINIITGHTNEELNYIRDTILLKKLPYKDYVSNLKDSSL